MELARRFWYIGAGFVGWLCISRAIDYYESQKRLRRRAASSVEFPTKPSNVLLEKWATATAIVREVSYPQLHIPVRGLSWLTPPPLGRVIVLVAYWIVIIYMMTHQSIVFDAFFWERIGFRNAWITITQLPLLYLLASKCSIVGFLVGKSHERLNFLHRWVGRTMLVTATVHGWHFYADWARADFVEYQIKMMPMIKYGFGAWGILLWVNLSSLAPLRRLAYEVFVLQHLVSAILLLWLLYIHVPPSAQYNIWFAVAALCFDRACRWAWLVWQNTKLAPAKGCKGEQRIGHQAQLRAVGSSLTVVTVKDVHFKWRAGQHLYLCIPRVGLAEAHPYTIACAHKLPDTCICNSIQLVVRKHGGFSKRLHEYAAKAQHAKDKAIVTAFVSGPFGVPPRWDIYETIVLISASTGASFTLPILESVLQNNRTNCAKRIDFLLAAKQGEEVDFYLSRLHELIDRANAIGIELNVQIAVTQGPLMTVGKRGFADDQDGAEPFSVSSSSGSQLGRASAEKAKGDLPDLEQQPRVTSLQRKLSGNSTDSHIAYLSERPDVGLLIRNAVEATGGETSVVVCGGPSLVSTTRNFVAKLSDERAVHKGTGAQGISLFVEEYSF